MGEIAPPESPYQRRRPVAPSFRCSNYRPRRTVNFSKNAIAAGEEKTARVVIDSCKTWPEGGGARQGRHEPGPGSPSAGETRRPVSFTPSFLTAGATRKGQTGQAAERDVRGSDSFEAHFKEAGKDAGWLSEALQARQLVRETRPAPGFVSSVTRFAAAHQTVGKPLNGARFPNTSGCQGDRRSEGLAAAAAAGRIKEKRSLGSPGGRRVAEAGSIRLDHGWVGSLKRDCVTGVIPLAGRGKKVWASRRPRRVARRRGL